MKRNCNNCGKEYEADIRNINRGWGLCCSKSCAASKREKSKPGYNLIKVINNNARRVSWNTNPIFQDENEFGIFKGRRTSEDYKVYERENGDFTAVDEFDEPVYDSNDINEDPGDSEYYDNKDY